CRSTPTGSRGSGIRSCSARSRTSSSTGPARIRPSRGKRGPPDKRRRATASSTSASARSRRGAYPVAASPRSTATSASSNGSRPLVDRLALVIAACFGAGYSPVAPGTVASALTVALLWLIPFSRGGLVLFLVVVVAVGVWAAQVAERQLGGKDPRA